MSAFVNFEVDRLKKAKIFKKVWQYSVCHCIRVFYILITVVFGSYEPFHLVNGRVRVGAIPT